jgi:uncharacterized membrane protein YeaQ/YmgE (transglycosylase-associated protein family)
METLVVGGLLLVILYVLAIGAIAGWLAGHILRGGGYGFLGNAALGILGGFVGRFLAHHVGLTPHGLIGGIIVATAGAVVLLFLAGLFRSR